MQYNKINFKSVLNYHKILIELHCWCYDFFHSE